MGKEHNKIIKRVKYRLKKELKQSGGDGLRQNNFDSSGSFGNMITQLAYFVENGVASIVDGITATYSVVTLPGDLGHILGKPNEPLPSNTKIAKILDPPVK